MKRHLIHRRMIAWGFGLALGVGLVAGPSRPCSAALTLKERIIKAEALLEFYAEKKAFFNLLAERADSEYNAKSQAKSQVWDPLKTRWLKYVAQLKKTEGATAVPVPFLQYLFQAAAIDNFKSRKFHPAFMKGEAVDEDGPDLTNLQVMKAYLALALKIRSLATTNAATADDYWRKTRNHLDELRADLTPPAPDGSSPTSAEPDTTDQETDPESPEPISPPAPPSP